MPAHIAEDAPLEDRINADSEAKRALAKLLSHRSVDERALWDCLDSLELSPLIGYKKWTDQSKLSKAKARRFAHRLTQTAKEIKGFFQPSYFWYATVQSQKFLWLNLVQRHLRLTAKLIETMLNQSDDRAADNTIDARIKLTRYVWGATGRKHDREVAALTAAILGFKKYTAEEQRKFRDKHCKQSLPLGS